MIIFSIPKAFSGHIGTIQRNAIESWLMFDPKPDIFLFGDDPGVKEAAGHYCLTHIPVIKKNNCGTPLLHDIFRKVQEINPGSRIYMYINTDIVLLHSPLQAVRRLEKQFRRFVAVGRRYELSVNRAMDQAEIANVIAGGGVRQKSNAWIDYFIFSTGVFTDIPPFALGKTFWDKWLLWHALEENIPVVDITEDVPAVHQTHSYAMNRKTSLKSVWAGNEALENLRLAGGWSNSATIADASYHLKNNRILPGKKRGRSVIRKWLDRTPSIWPVLLQARLLRERFSTLKK